VRADVIQVTLRTGDFRVNPHFLGWRVYSLEVGPTGPVRRAKPVKTGDAKLPG
jgi:hypothetical protein